MTNLKRLTEKKKKFLDNYVVTGSVVDASNAAGYTQPGSCYRLVEKDARGVYTDPSVRQYIAQLHGVTAAKPMATIVEIRPNVQTSVDMESPTVESVHNLLWELARDSTMSSGARVAAATALLKDLRGEPVEVEVVSEDLLEDLKGTLGVG